MSAHPDFVDTVIFFFLWYIEILDHIIRLVDYPTKIYWAIAWCSFHYLVLGPGLWHVIKDPIGMSEWMNVAIGLSVRSILVLRCGRTINKYSTVWNAEEANKMDLATPVIER